MLAAAERWGGGADERPFLPRAFSVMRRIDGRLEFMLEAVGPGTTRLGELRAGDGLWLAGPFGIGFAPPRDGRAPLLVGGGVGTAPLAIWQDSATRRVARGSLGLGCPRRRARRGRVTAARRARRDRRRQRGAQRSRH